jgi:hypothetical protein
MDTVEQIIDAVGGTAAAAVLAGVTPPAVSNWKARGFIPSDLFVVFAEALERRGMIADRSAFGFKAPVEARP